MEAQVKQLEMEKSILEQAAVLISKMPNKLYALITQLSHDWSVKALYQILRVSRSAYYAWKNPPVDHQRPELRSRVREWHRESSHEANNAFWITALVRTRSDHRTKDYAQHQTNEGCQLKKYCVV
ncbi:hypothetical protein [Photorhabdus laumondii]